MSRESNAPSSCHSFGYPLQGKKQSVCPSGTPFRGWVGSEIGTDTSRRELPECDQWRSLSGLDDWVWMSLSRGWDSGCPSQLSGSPGRTAIALSYLPVSNISLHWSNHCYIPQTVVPAFDEKPNIKIVYFRITVKNYLSPTTSIFSTAIRYLHFCWG